MPGSILVTFHSVSGSAGVTCPVGLRKNKDDTMNKFNSNWSNKKKRVFLNCTNFYFIFFNTG
jgi:hypothetical protein